MDEKKKPNILLFNRNANAAPTAGPLPIKRRKRLVLRVMTTALIALTILAAGLTLFTGGELSADGVKRAFTVLTGRSAVSFEIPEGFSSAFYDFGSSVAAAGKMGAAVIGPGGEELARELLSLPSAVIVSNGKTAAVYSPGGYDVLLLDSTGKCVRIRTESEIRSVYAGRGGVTAVSTGSVDEYRGAVYVYKTRGGEAEVIYEWYSGTDYVLSAAISDDNKTLAALTLGENGSRIVFYKLNSTRLAAETIYPQAILEIAYMKNDMLFARTRDKLLYVSPDGGIEPLYEYSGFDTEAFTADGGEFAALYLSGRGGGYMLVTADLRGRVSESHGDYGKCFSLRINGEQTALLTDSGIYVFRDPPLARYAFFENTAAYTDAFPRGEAAVYAAGSRNGIVLRAG